ncbi:hypothetical protein ACFOLC_13155 [Lysobacter cavernae]|uniref:Lipoprotein n=1 Tax=Lysobacter cavernae TaxID=1685901 RepID=A0ABV7RTD2_9GAMM
MRLGVVCAVVGVLAGCSGVEYHDTNPLVDARPECASHPDHPNDPGPAWCERKVEARRSDAARPIDLSGQGDDGT